MRPGHNSHYMANPVHFVHIRNAFRTLGWVEKNDTSDWKLLWSYRDPFYSHHPSFVAIKAMAPGQKVNQLPGSGWFTYKWYLAEVAPKLDCLPITFQLPRARNEFISFAKQHEGQYDWVVKNEGHKGVKAVTPESEAVAKIVNNTLVQQLVRPVLISGRSWDLGVYVAITSSHPLKVYVYNDIVLRFCQAKYIDPVVEPENVNAYVVGDHYTAPWELPATKKHLDKGLNYLQALQRVLKEQGHAVDDLVPQLKVLILELLLKMQPKLKGVSDGYTHGASSFFAMYRFDFMLDQHLRPYIMEVNLSPNLSSTRHQPLAGLFIKVLNDLVRLVGFGPEGAHRNIEMSPEIEQQLSSKDVGAADSNSCQACVDTDCASTQIDCVARCAACRTPAQQQAILDVVSEHAHQGPNWSRVYPIPQDLKELAAQYVKQQPPVGDLNNMLQEWMQSACQKDGTWC
ncbi:Ttll-15p, variant 2 [Trebouxia sp. C0009 RCD-2024]